MSAWKKNVSQRLHLLPPHGHSPWHSARCWGHPDGCPGAGAALLLPSIPGATRRAGDGHHLFIVKLTQNWGMSPGRMMDSPLPGIFQRRLKKKKKKKNHEKSSSSLPEKLHRWCMCVEKGVWARVLPGLGSQTAKPQHPARWVGWQQEWMFVLPPAHV